MELNSNLIGIQGVLINCSKQSGEFAKINYRGGNEEKILLIASELSKFLHGKGFMNENKPRAEFKKELNDIVFFLAINTVFKKNLNLDEYSHLTNIIPQLSKCLLANICFGLDLVEQYGHVIENLSCEITEELLDQAIECLRKEKPKEHLEHVTILLKSVANKISTVEINYKTEDTVEDIVRVVNIILQNILSLSTDQVTNMSQKNIYHHMGLTLLDLFELLLYINENTSALKSFANCLLSTASTLIKCVTLNVFCTWAEVDYDDQPLQTIVAGKAYLVVEKYKKYKPATELVNMLGNIARKPKTISELILEADVPTMIKKVNEKDQHQKLWFRALLNTPIFQNPKIVECIDRWYTLCDDSDLDRLLSVPLPTNAQERQLIVKCASNLSLEALHRILNIYFHREKFVWQEDIQEKLVLFFNQVEAEMTVDQRKEVLLLVLQNARMFFYHFYYAALKNCSEMAEIFIMVKDIAKIGRIGLDVLLKVFEENVPSDQNLTNYKKLIDMIVACQYYNWEYFVVEVPLKLIHKYRGEGSMETFFYWLQILKYYDKMICDIYKEVEILDYLLTCASEYRCKSFLEFRSLDDGITKCCVEYVLKRSEDFDRHEPKEEYFSNLGKSLDDPWSKYYRNRFLGFTAQKERKFLDHLLPNFRLTLYKEGKPDKNFTRLLKVLPRCVSIEWKMVLKEIEEECGFPLTLNALSDILILLCDITESQNTKEVEENKLIPPLKLCLQNYGRFLSLESRSKEHQIEGINNVCRVLRHIPDVLKPTEGMSLINLLPSETLKSLACDKEFVARIVLINDKQICKVLAQKVLGAY